MRRLRLPFEGSLALDQRATRPKPRRPMKHLLRQNATEALVANKHAQQPIIKHWACTCCKHTKRQLAAKQHAIAHAEREGGTCFSAALGQGILICRIWQRQSGWFLFRVNCRAGMLINASLQPQIGFPTRIPRLIRNGRNHQNKRYLLVLRLPQWFPGFLELLGERWLENLLFLVFQHALYRYMLKF